MRILVREDTGFRGHPFVDSTDTPAPTMSTGQIGFKLVAGAAPTRDDSKPAYQIPSTAEILATPSSGYRAVGTFSGCGGSSLGLTWAGIKMVRAYEFDHTAATSYAANLPSPVDVSDVRELSAADVLAACSLKAGELDIFEGSPPCSKFSMAGKREKSWNKTTGSDSTIKQANVEDLFFEWIRLVGGIRPRIALAENVRGLAIGTAKGHLKLIVRTLREIGYRVVVWDLDAQWLGTPQRRRRLIFVAVRDDLPGGLPAAPAPLPYRYSVADALPHLVNARAFGLERGQAAPGEPSGTIMASDNGWNPGHVVEADADKPRTFTIAELKRICGFPDDYELVGSTSQQWARLGNAVVPPMYLHVGRQLVNFLDQLGPK